MYMIQILVAFFLNGSYLKLYYSVAKHRTVYVLHQELRIITVLVYSIFFYREEHIYRAVTFTNNKRATRRQFVTKNFI